MHDHVHVRAVVVRGRFFEDFATGFQFVKNLLEPKLVGLMDDNEQHLVMRVQFSLDQAERRLESKELVDGEVTAVIGGVLGSAKGTFHESSVANSFGTDKRDYAIRDTRFEMRDVREQLQ